MESPRGVLLAIALLSGAGWMSACESNSPTDPSEAPATADVAALGAGLYESHCSSCHGGETGGEITSMPPPHNANGHTWHHPDCQLIGTVMRGKSRGSVEMPAFGDQLSEADVSAILAHIRTWWAEEQREFQEEVTRTSC